MSTSFAVPCAVCGYSNLPIYHGGTHRYFLHGNGDGQHVYTPDESSVEFAALKLREALDSIVAEHLEQRRLRMAGESMSHGMIDLFGKIDEAQAAITLADAAGIKAESSP